MVGLGNPGPEYANTRHNVGHMVVDYWADDAGVSLKRFKAAGAVAKAVVKPPIYLAHTSGYMNVSGPPAKQIASFYGITPDRVVVIHDDLDLPFQTMRLKFGGGHGGHNGLKSLQAALGTADFFRIRLGIGRPEGRKPAAVYVLENFTSTEKNELPLTFQLAKDAVMAIVSEGLTAAQQQFHRLA